MFTNHKINIHKQKIKKLYVIIHSIVLLFSLNLNYLFFAPNFANALSDGNMTIGESVEGEIILDIGAIGTGDSIDGITSDIVEVATGDTLGETTSDIDTGSTISTGSWGEGMVGDIFSNTGYDFNTTGTTIDQSTEATTITTDTGIQTETGQSIDDGYFTSSFTKDAYDDKIIDLQNILQRLGLFTGEVNGFYDETTIQSVYHYQVLHEIIDPINDPISLRGFLGPKTRYAFNQEYILYRQSLLDGLTQVSRSSGEGLSSVKADRVFYIERIKSYFFANRYSLRNIFGSGVFVGNNDIDFSLLSGKIELPLIFQSTNTLDGSSAEVLFAEGTVLKTEDGDVFTGNLASPTFLDLSVADELTGQNILSVLDVGGNDEKILLENGSGEEISSIVKIPVPGQLSGALLDINYSHDGETWTYMVSQEVFLENGEPYVQFETNHFTLFSVGLPVGTFFINDNDVRAYDINVTLNSHVYGATHMRFSNTEAGLTSASWVAYATGYAWTLIDTDDIHTVYAQFSGVNGIQSASDSISVIRSTSNIKTLLAGLMSGDIAIDESNTNNFQTYGGITNPIINGEQVYDLDGSTQYMQTGNIGITAYPFTFSAWINPDTIAGTDTIMMMGNSATATMFWGISLVAGKATIVASNTTARTTSATATLTPGTWYHVVGVFASATSRTLYVNGAQVATNTTSVTFASTNQQVRVGRYAGTATANYFDGQMDGIRIYNKALTVPEIQTIYNARQPILTTKQMSVGDFVINDDAKVAYTGAVLLSNSVDGATHMRFSNTEAGLSSASWVSFATGYNWTLDTTSSGNKFVYAEFSGNGRKGVAQDNIFLEIITDSTLKALLPGDFSGTTTILDRSLSNNNFTGFGGIEAIKDGGYRVFSLDGATEYMERGTIGITAYPFTFSARIQPHTIAGTDTIMMMGNSATATMFWGISLVAGKATIVASNTTARTSSATATLVPGTWYHVVGVFASATSRTLYVNGAQVATNTTSVTFANTNQQVRVGRYVGSATANYFDGNMDDIRIYSKQLNTTEISALYQSRIDRALTPTATVTYDITGSTSGPVVATLTGFSESVTIVNNGGSNQYTFTGNGSFTFFFTNSVGNVGSAIASVDWINASSGTLSITGPSSFTFGSTVVSPSNNSLEKVFTGGSDYFQVEDTLGSDAGYYTTLAVSSLQYNASTISNANMYVKTVGGITLLAGTANSNVVTSIGNTYTNAASPLTFIMRSAGSNGGKKGTYGAQIAIRVDIPAFQNAGNYTGNIIYTIY